MRIGIYTAISMLMLTAGAALAQSQIEAPADDGHRFRLEKTETGYIRLDQKTGAVSFCRENQGNLTCRLAADERQAFEQDLDLLAKRVAALEQKLGAGAPPTTVPSDAEIEKSLSIMEQFMRRFMGIINEFRAEDQQAPNRL
ncbi:hypothetical protein [Affinirhizobium pseudoryzae]|uniref:hypothetical protein n=1 Tax=Allorhizobium pseudoryzae TaxID=379684 RepID=UPI0013EDCE63|nr:hypothetical protein [Allorhizobium pseudoryzae]